MGNNEIYVHVCGTVQIPISKSLASTTLLHHKLDERSGNKGAILQSIKISAQQSKHRIKNERKGQEETKFKFTFLCSFSLLSDAEHTHHIFSYFTHFYSL
jgi:hypothetical protein